MVQDVKSLAYLFTECMVYNDRIFCHDDFNKLLISHRINEQDFNFDAVVKNTLFLFNQKGFHKIYFLSKMYEKNYWHPCNADNFDLYSIENIIEDLRLDLDNEFNSDDLFTNFVNHLNKINNYISFIKGK